MTAKRKCSSLGIISLALLAYVLLLRSAYGQTVHGINWTWQPITTDMAGNTIIVSGYNVYCSTSATGPFTTKTNTSLITTTSYLETGLTAGDTYYCQYTGVLGSLEGGHSPTSAGVLFQFPPAASPAAPSGTVQ